MSLAEPCARGDYPIVEVLKWRQVPAFFNAMLNLWFKAWWFGILITDICLEHGISAKGICYNAKNQKPPTRTTKYCKYIEYLNFSPWQSMLSRWWSGLLFEVPRRYSFSYRRVVGWKNTKIHHQPLSDPSRGIQLSINQPQKTKLVFYGVFAPATKTQKGAHTTLRVLRCHPLSRTRHGGRGGNTNGRCTFKDFTWACHAVWCSPQRFWKQEWLGLQKRRKHW